MRLFLIFFLLICTSFKFSYGQVKHRISVPVLKESIKIDSLIDIVLDIQAQHFKDINKSKDDWIIIYMTKIKDNEFYFSLGPNSRVEVNSSINIMKHDKVNCGMFTYKKYKIFVWVNDYFYEFFHKTTKSKSFSYIYKLNNIDHSPDNLKGEKIWGYKYKEGRFSIDNPPEIR